MYVAIEWYTKITMQEICNKTFVYPRPRSKVELFMPDEPDSNKLRSSVASDVELRTRRTNQLHQIKKQF